MTDHDTKHKVLVIDDSKHIRNFVKLVLEQEGFEVELADCGETGVEVALAANFDALLIDLRMPGIGGVEALSKIRDAGNEVPAIAFSAADAESVDLSDSHFTTFVPKPIEIATLISTISGIISQ